MMQEGLYSVSGQSFQSNPDPHHYRILVIKDLNSSGDVNILFYKDADKPSLFIASHETLFASLTIKGHKAEDSVEESLKTVLNLLNTLPIHGAYMVDGRRFHGKRRFTQQETNNDS